jgi:LPPG:FO 2-phospho-L-lactate transferase
MLSGLAAVTGPEAITAVVNTGDDMVLHGLYISPDLDTVTYTLAGAANPGTGWGLAGESWTVMESLAAFEGHRGRPTSSLTWFNLGDRDLATHLFRTGAMLAGAPLSEVTADITRRYGVGARLLPMTDDRVETRVVIDTQPAPPLRSGRDRTDGHARSAGPAGPAGPSGPAGNFGMDGVARAEPRFGGLPAAPEPPPLSPGTTEIGFQEYFVGLRHDVAIKSVRFVGAATASPAPGVLASIAAADVVVICPSNPIVSVGPVLAVPGIAEAVTARRASTVAVSPIIAGKALKGPADRMLVELGYEPSAVGVAKMWAPLACTLVVDEADADLAPRVEAEGLRCLVAPSVMSGPAEARALAEVVLGATGHGHQS